MSDIGIKVSLIYALIKTGSRMAVLHKCWLITTYVLSCSTWLSINWVLGCDGFAGIYTLDFVPSKSERVMLIQRQPPVSPGLTHPCGEPQSRLTTFRLRQCDSFWTTWSVYIFSSGD